ncbi:pyridoxal phosphate-dependent aminotransferase [Hoeflea prorocentri]|uniref:aspartate transaminase n=1 Tax=Hoeflea prorocentri TaxID=1922333 RepID=A0A9X3ZI35_9HYPH|nr:pyridoxal phosphate-dependent aminotransferase [Hoeflea prorocentri]MCY6382497.1 pyridoxal phosphate-dependent aminotransferase [Hoeflea prorocentri]MDA5400297.1 pyridoxal phosphate-dependent aminotransferase [Hoeflea prorocentri]
MSFLDSLSPQARSVPESEIVAVVNHARLREDVVPLWVGEGDRPTPAFICDATERSLRAGETFYTWQRGIPPLRQALADYYGRHFGTGADPETFFVTGSGMLAIRMSIEAVAAPGDEIIYLSPAWPNIVAALQLSSTRAVGVQLDFTDGGWHLDMDRLAAAIGPRTRALFINTPSNPTGWTANSEELSQILELARKAGIWVIADEIYARFFYSGHRSDSFLDIADENDRIIYVNTFSKNWSMTGWRIGWIKAPAELGQVFENLVQFSTSGVPQFTQQGALAAISQGDDYVEELKEQARRNRDILCDALLSTNRVRLSKPDGTFYAFFAIDGMEDSRAAAYRIVDETGIGLAPGCGFAEGGEAFLRACFLRKQDHVETAADRLSRFISNI